MKAHWFAPALVRPTSFRRRSWLLALVALLALPLTAALAAGGNSITAPAPHAIWSSLALDSNGYPVVSYYDYTNDDLKLLHCNDADCAGGDESITAPDTDGDVGWSTSLALDSNGYPVVSYYDVSNAGLKVLHCNDADCSGGDESITAPDTSGFGLGTSLALDSSGYPVVSYWGYGGLKVLHCNDADCSGGDESITVADPGGSVGNYSSLALDSNGYPVVSYSDYGNGDLKLLHCNDADCSGGDESITAPDTAGFVGDTTSLALDSNGYPVVSYSDYSNGDLKLLHCNDADCSGGDESITAPDTAGDVGLYTALALDSNGYPVVSYSDYSNGDLKLLHCNDADCSGGDESITAADTDGDVGDYTSLALDSSGYPVVSYTDYSNQDLKVLHCGDLDCTVSSDSTPPVIAPTVSGTLGNNGWYTSDVAVSWSVSDGESAISSTSGCDPTTIDSDTAGTTLTCEATSDGGTNSESATIQRDATPPVVSVTGVADGATYPLGSVPAADCDTQDATSGVATNATVSLSGGDGNGLGSFTATCDGATDTAGNSAAPLNVSYTVTQATTTYDFTGFLPPIHNPPALNTRRAGPLILLRFSLHGDRGRDIFAAGYPASQQINCTTLAPIGPVEPTRPAGSTGLVYNRFTDRYLYVWNTDRAMKNTCRQFILGLDDGSQHLAHFKFR